MKKVDSHPRRQLFFTVQREERIVHRIGILARDTGCGIVRLERAAITMRGDAKSRVVLQRAERGPLPRVWGQEFLAKGLEREPQRWTCDRAVSPDHHASGLEPRLACTVRPRAALRCLDVDRPVNGVEFG